MDMLAGNGSLQFGDFHFDWRARKLSRRCATGDWEPVTLGSRASELLAVLTDRPGEVVSRDTIMDAVWPGVAVEPNNMTVQIAALRRVLDEGRSGESCIQTVPGRGYRFVLGVTRGEAAVYGSSSAAIAEPMLAKGTVRWWRPGWRRPTTGSGGITVAALAAADPRQPAPAGVLAQWRAILIAALTALLVGGTTGGGWWMLRNTTAPPASTKDATAAAQDRRLSVIILPLENSSDDPVQDGLAAQLTYVVTDRIARAQDGPVIPGMTAAAYLGKEVDPGAIGRQYDVHFVLVGNVRRQDERLIVLAILYETAGGRTVWSRHFDLPDGRDGQRIIAQVIYEGSWQASVDEEAKRAMREHPNSLDKRDLVLAALSTRLAAPTKVHFLERVALVERALALDPNDFEALERQARLHSALVLMGYSSAPPADLAIAEKAADHMLLIDPNSTLSLRARATVLRAQGNWSEAEAVLLRVIESQPTEANRRNELGQVLMAEARHQEALESFQTAKRFAGGTDNVFAYDANIALADVAIGQFAEAIAMARLSMSEFPPDSGRLGEFPWLALIGAESGSGQDEAARSDLQRFLAAPRTWRTLAEVQKNRAFAANPKLVEGLRRAGMPAE